jgi:hypothetical protein
MLFSNSQVWSLRYFSNIFVVKGGCTWLLLCAMSQFIFEGLFAEIVRLLNQRHSFARFLFNQVWFQGWRFRHEWNALRVTRVLDLHWDAITIIHFIWWDVSGCFVLSKRLLSPVRFMWFLDFICDAKKTLSAFICNSLFEIVSRLSEHFIEDDGQACITSVQFIASVLEGTTTPLNVLSLFLLERVMGEIK